MKFRNPFRREKRLLNLQEALIRGGILTKEVNKDQAMSIPVFAACVELICGTIASLPICLYEIDEDSTKKINDDREKLLNHETNDTLDGYQMKYAVVQDYLLEGAGYIYINRSGNNVKSLNYVMHDYVAVNFNFDPIFKQGEFLIYGERFRNYELLKLLRRTKDGFTGKGIVRENNEMLSIAYNMMKFEDALVKTNGSKKGFLKAQSKLGQDAMDELKKGWRDLYSTDSQENILVLNNGLDFQEASLTSVELQLNENKITNADQICKMFLVPPSLLAGTATNEEYLNWIKVCISPIISALETALNKDLLLPSEQGNKRFAADTSELLKADVETRMRAYEIGIKNAIYKIDEVRKKENLPALDLDFLKFGLQDVFFFPDENAVYTPNTNAKYDINAAIDPNQQTQASAPPNITLNKGGDNTMPNQSKQNQQKGDGKSANLPNNAGSNQNNGQSVNNDKKG